MIEKAKLPDYCFAKDLMNPGKIIIIKYGESGYYPTDYSGDAMEYNKKIGVTEPQMEAMIDASMFGWDIAETNLELHEKCFKENEPNKYNLPDFCFANDTLDESKIIIIKNGESGYYPTDYSGDAMEYNEKIGVTECQMEAMVSGSMFGWDIPLANPETWKEIFSKKN